jgi:tetratricopeptide (TPR) repeat protein
VLGQARAGVSLPAALFLVALAALQGLIVVGAFSLFLQPHKAGAAAPTSRSGSPNAQNSASLSSALPAGADQHAPTLAGAGAVGAAERVAASAEPPAPDTQSTRDIGVDESGLHAPSCSELLGETQVHAGNYPGAAYGQVRAANRALVQGDLDASERALCKAVLWNQTNPAIPFELAQLMLLRRDGAKALDWARQGLAKDPANARGQGILGDAWARLGKYDQAKQAWLSSLRLEPSSDEEQKTLSLSSLREARASLKRRDLARAERFFRRAAAQDSDNAQASNGLADVLLRLGDTQAALRWANHSVSVAPRDASARVILGDVLFQQGEHDAAEVEWREALRLEPEDFIAKLRLSRLNHALARASESR